MNKCVCVLSRRLWRSGQNSQWICVYTHPGAQHFSQLLGWDDFSWCCLKNEAFHCKKISAQNVLVTCIYIFRLNWGFIILWIVATVFSAGICKILFHCFLVLMLSKSSINPFCAHCSVEEQSGSVLYQRQADHRHATPLWHRRDHLLLPPSHQWTGDLGSTWAHKHDPDCYGNITVAPWCWVVCIFVHCLYLWYRSCRIS